MSSTTWYVRLDEQVLGPVSDAELRDLVKQGGVTPQTPVSSGNATWIDASAVQGVFFGAPPPPHACPARIATSPRTTVRKGRSHAR